MDLLKMLNEEWIKIDDSFKFKGEDMDLIDRKEELKLEQDLKFSFKEMKIDKDFYHLLVVSLSEKIKADCNYKAVLYLDPDSYNANIRGKYYDLANKIKELFEDIQKWGLFNTEDWMKTQVKTIKEHYDNMIEEIQDIQSDYLVNTERYIDYSFGCSVKSLENTSYDVKKCSFIIGSESFVDLAKMARDFSSYRIGLAEEKLLIES